MRQYRLPGLLRYAAKSSNAWQPVAGVFQDNEPPTTDNLKICRQGIGYKMMHYCI